MTEHTPGRWAWRGYAKSRTLYLMSDARMHPLVMDFTRWGMVGATPRFNVDGIMHRADELLATVGSSETIVGINHPDAHLIAAAPDLYEACQAALPIVQDYMAWRLAENDPAGADEVAKVLYDLVERAIAKARGETP